MHENFPSKKPGDALSARHINDLGRVFGRLSRISGTNQDIRQSGSTISVASSIPWEQHIVIISNLKINAGDTDDSGLYLVQIRYYSFDDAEWKTDDSKEWILDTTSFTVIYKVGDKVVAYWDELRGAYVPMGAGKGRHFELDEQ